MASTLLVAARDGDLTQLRILLAAGVDVGMLATDQGLGCDRNASADPFESIGSVRIAFLFSSVRAGT